MAVLKVYEAPGGAFVPVSVEVRPKTVLPADPAEHRKFTFLPLTAEGQSASIRRYTLTDDEFTAYMAAESATDRAAILAAKTASEQTSALRPTMAQLQRVAAEHPEAYGPEFWQSGRFILVSDAAESAAKTKRGTLEERSAVAVASLMALIPAPAETSEAPTKTAK